jgi:hypothetical protein
LHRYSKHIYPQFPIVHIKPGDGHIFIDPGVRAAIYIIAHHFSTFDESLCIQTVYDTLPLAQLQEFALRYLNNHRHRPTIASLQGGLLLAISPAANMLMPETEERALLAGMVTGMANALGLQHDPSEWEVSEEEKAMRQKLSALVKANDTWTALAAGRPPFISSDNWNADTIDAHSISIPGEDISTTFVKYAQLTDILTRVLQDV